MSECDFADSCKFTISVSYNEFLELQAGFLDSTAVSDTINSAPIEIDLIIRFLDPAILNKYISPEATTMQNPRLATKANLSAIIPTAGKSKLHAPPIPKKKSKTPNPQTSRFFILSMIHDTKETIKAAMNQTIGVAQVAIDT